ncbi:hypothetical protein [Bradyrhizobium sp.]|jgi:hypothetical protein|uniref:hypothetical protein n=1 Tax=Bradyrhizobium sp. TaxID=376 RepID=UPI002E017917|nr:hypothetical protein [Bradyrhizobium sp.]
MAAAPGRLLPEPEVPQPAAWVTLALAAPARGAEPFRARALHHRWIWRGATAWIVSPAKAQAPEFPQCAELAAGAVGSRSDCPTAACFRDFLA